jgi:hypothetical protein
MQDASLAYADPLEAAIAIEEATVSDRDFCIIILDKSAIHVKPHRIPFRLSISASYLCA